MQVERNQSVVPIRVNEPKMVGPFAVTEVAPVVVLTAIGVMLDMTNYGLIVGIGIAFLQVKITARFPPGFLFHYLWFKGLWPLPESKTVLDPMKRKFYQ
ncbi:type IV conjugative transfer system protein TraL [Photobacterium sp. ZSDE20]|uniref:Type IV conjugative transfer system protein TraL n=1 Tax=Photobacterium pectinilyticum TaxID=2906793 RepID=A0ABT1N0X8_9GAMM|nr:type IV conjugative transfer system protein TraL [Photobacterium sp. ZSDE20]MCQ1058401.1 type IV conjugative transfer system protein TraL [Photobacterium sp. ZSDE20]MDD1825236.1 type IV conjugative transfer system protein TraL [Photobacterium sp. ZSDE20]